MHCLNLPAIDALAKREAIFLAADFSPRPNEAGRRIKGITLGRIGIDSEGQAIFAYRTHDPFYFESEPTAYRELYAWP